MANLELIDLLEEPVAAALATGLQKYANVDTHILVYDFGGGTLDVTILKVANNRFYVVSMAGDDYLGGQDIDNILIDTVIDEYLSENNEGEERTKPEIRSNKKLLAAFKTAISQVKVELAGNGINAAEISIDALGEDGWLHSLSRATFEQVVFEEHKEGGLTFRERMLAPIDEAFEKA